MSSLVAEGFYITLDWSFIACIAGYMSATCYVQRYAVVATLFSCGRPLPCLVVHGPLVDQDNRLIPFKAFFAGQDPIVFHCSDLIQASVKLGI